MTVRIPPLDEIPEGLLARAGAVVGGGIRGEGVVYRTLAQHPDLFLAWLSWGSHVLRRSSIPARVRELVILRVAAVAGAQYPFTQHVRIGRAAGLDDADVAAVIAGPGSRHWSDAERCALTATDQIAAAGGISDDVWRNLEAEYDLAQRLDFISTVAFYRLASRMLNACGSPLDKGQEPCLTSPATLPSKTSIGQAGDVRARALPPDEWSSRLLEATENWPRFKNRLGIRKAGVYGTLANNAELFLSIGPMMAHLMVANSLENVHREAVIVRACLLDRAAYPYRQHWRIGRDAGLDQRTLEALASHNPKVADEKIGVLTRLVDDLHALNRISDKTWRHVASLFSDRQIMDAVATAGFYGLIGAVLNACGTPLEPGEIDLPDIPPEPKPDYPGEI